MTPDEEKEAQAICQWLYEHGVDFSYKCYQVTRESHGEILERYWNPPACAFAARDRCVERGLAMEWHEKLMEVPAFPWDYIPLDWLRAAKRVLENQNG